MKQYMKQPTEQDFLEKILEFNTKAVYQKASAQNFH